MKDLSVIEAKGYNVVINGFNAQLISEGKIRKSFYGNSKESVNGWVNEIVSVIIDPLQGNNAIWNEKTKMYDFDASEFQGVLKLSVPSVGINSWHDCEITTIDGIVHTVLFRQSFRGTVKRFVGL